MNRRLLIVWRLVWVALIVSWLMAASALARGWSQYGANKTLNLTGVIRKPATPTLMD
jgi:hypothetical protein